MNWNDVRFVLSVARTGNLVGAARQLGVHHATVARRIAAIEQDLKVRLFDRMEGKYVPTAVCDSVLMHCAELEEAALAVKSAVIESVDSLSGEIRVTTTSFLAAYLMQHVAEFRTRYPDVEVEITVDSRDYDITRREADMALRCGLPRVGRATVRKMATMAFAVFGHADQFSANADRAELEDLRWVCLDDAWEYLPEARWLRSNYPRARRVLRTNDIQCLHSAIRNGNGIGVLPCFMADPDDELVRLSGPEPVTSNDLFLLVHQDLRNNSRIVAFVDWLNSTFGLHKALFTGLP
ncbi:LysR family transcriptional regulator [Roseibium sp. M-1]